MFTPSKTALIQRTTVSGAAVSSVNIPVLAAEWDEIRLRIRMLNALGSDVTLDVRPNDSTSNLTSDRHGISNAAAFIQQSSDWTLTSDCFRNSWAMVEANLFLKTGTNRFFTSRHYSYNPSIGTQRQLCQGGGMMNDTSTAITSIKIYSSTVLAIGIGSVIECIGVRY